MPEYRKTCSCKRFHRESETFFSKSFKLWKVHTIPVIIWQLHYRETSQPPECNIVQTYRSEEGEGGRGVVRSKPHAAASIFRQM